MSTDVEHVRVVGTQQYQDTIWRIVGPPTDDADTRASWHGEATLEPEPENPHDPQAVRVVVDGQTVGYLPRELAARIHDQIDARNEPVVVPAYAKGGFMFRDGTRASVGLALRFDPDELLR